MDLLSIVATALTGGATGLIGSIGMAVLEYKNTQLKMKHEIAMSEQRSKETIVEAEANIKVAKVNADMEMETAAADAFVKSMEQANEPLFDKSYFRYIPDWAKGWVAVMFALVDIIKGTIRPFLTYSLTGTLAVLLAVAYSKDPAGFWAEVLKMVPIIIHTIVYLATTTTLWWFGERMTKNLRKKIMF